MDWKQFESTLRDESETAFRRWTRENPGQHVYALALHEGFRELDGVMNLHSLAVNSIEALQQAQAAEEVELQWNPADWAWTNIFPESSDRLEELAADLNQEANRGSPRHWQKTEKRFLSVMVRIAKSLRTSFAGEDYVTKDFVVYVSDDSSDFEVLRRCLPRSLFKKYFANFEPKGRTGSTSASPEQLREYLEEPWSYEREILSLGDAAIEPLIERMSQPNGYYAAQLLGMLGSRDSRVIDALVAAARTEGGLAESSTRSLFRLQQIDRLREMLDAPDTRKRAVQAITTGLKCLDHDQLDYQHVERLLESDHDDVAALVSEELKAGSSCTGIKASDCPEALRGLESRHAVIRCHAVSVLGDRGLGRKLGKQILPELAKRLGDEDATVRRLTLLSLSYWKSAAKPYHDTMRALKEDPDREVRITATYVFE